MTERTYAVAIAPRKDSRTWSQEEIRFSDLVEWAENPAGHKECGNYLLGTLRGGRRTKNTIVSRSAVQLDADRATEETWDAISDLGALGLIHTTYSSAPDELRLRAVLPLDREVTPDEYVHIVAVLLDRLGADAFDPGSLQPERYMFRPAVADEHRQWYRYEVLDGPELSADELLADFTEDLSTVPAPRPSKNKRDPREIDGTIGAFNRAYSIAEAIEQFGIPYEPAGEGRWHLVGARAGAGIHEVTPDLVYSHHAGDPAYGQTLSAFDLVRVHLYGILDEDAKPGTPINKLPSTTAALERLANDPRVVAEIVGDDFSTLPDADPDDPTAPAPARAWVMDLVRNPRSGEVKDVVGNWDLISENDPVFQGLFWDELDLSVKTDRDLPWRSLERGEVFTATDRAALALHIERSYGIRPGRLLLDDLVNVVAHRRPVHPVREYLEGLEWDGVPRLEESLPGVRPTEYTRLVARKCLTAAVARIFEPGIKWDYSLIIYGSEGRGKTFWVDRMARGWNAALGDIHSKDTLLTLQRSWIVTSDEGFSMKKSDADSLKEFLTRTTDVFRLPYEREVMAYPRHCVIWGTTNDPTFLRRQEGNRRYLIVHSEDRVDFGALTDDYVDQVWAEAVHLYRSGEKLFLDEEGSAIAAAAREAYIEEDSLSGIIQEWLDQPVPENWEEMGAEERALWRMETADGIAPKGTRKINRTCSTQIWVECLGRPIGDRRRADLLDIAAALRALPGWRPVPGRTRVPIYGPQQVYERVEELDELL